MNNLSNFREFGGIKSHHGIVKKGMIYRGGPLTNLTDEEKETFLNTNVKTIYDLRSDEEISKCPDEIFETIEWKHLDISKEIHDLSADPNVFTKSITKESVFNYMQQLYRDIILSNNSQKLFAEMLSDMACEGKPIYFHCTAGKDRTGIAAMLILHVLGVSKEEIFNDFLKTNENIHQIIKKLDKGYQNHRGENFDVEALKPMVGVAKEYLEAAIETIESNYISLDSYIENQLNINSDRKRKLIEFYIDK